LRLAILTKKAGFEFKAEAMIHAVKGLNVLTKKKILVFDFHQQ